MKTGFKRIELVGGVVVSVSSAGLVTWSPPHWSVKDIRDMLHAAQEECGRRAADLGAAELALEWAEREVRAVHLSLTVGK